MRYLCYANNRKGNLEKMTDTTTFHTLLAEAERNALDGRPASVDLCLRLAEACAEADTHSPADAPETLSPDREANLQALCEAADRIRRAHCGDHFDTCSIINGRSGRCSENCRWCAQAAAHHTGCAEYLFVDPEEFHATVGRNDARGVGRFSIVCSGRKVGKADLRRFADMYRQAAAESDMTFCASMGLLDDEEMEILRQAGVTRYHCNLETAASLFPSLCSTHSRADKLRTIRAAQRAGMQVCSGGIIGMGETLRQRLELAEEVREAGATSMPVNLLNPIPGTPLEGTPLISEREVVLSCALMRLIAPKLTIRFAGGRARISPEATARMLRGGVNGAIVGDMLTTAGNGLDSDFELFRSLGYSTARTND